MQIPAAPARVWFGDLDWRGGAPNQISHRDGGDAERGGRDSCSEVVCAFKFVGCALCLGERSEGARRGRARRERAGGGPGRECRRRAPRAGEERVAGEFGWPPAAPAVLEKGAPVLPGERSLSIAAREDALSAGSPGIPGEVRGLGNRGAQDDPCPARRPHSQQLSWSEGWPALTPGSRRLERAPGWPHPGSQSLRGDLWLRVHRRAGSGETGAPAGPPGGGGLGERSRLSLTPFSPSALLSQTGEGLSAATPFLLGSGPW